MALVLILLVVVPCILVYSEVTAQIQCPVNCTCTSGNSQCSYIMSSISAPFPDNVVNVTISVSNLRLEPNIFGTHMRNIVIERTNITEIASYTFANLPSLKSLRFKGVFIRSIKPCSFLDIQSPAEIEFSDSKIDRFEAGAFSNMPGLERISISLTTLDDIDSHAFFNIGVREFLITDTDIINMNTSSLSSIYNVENFQFSMVSIVSVKAGAFRNINNIQNVNIEGCTFKDLHCNAVMELREATPGNHDTFVFSDSQLVCNCLIFPMLDYAREHKNAIRDNVLCFENATMNQPLKNFKIPKLCTEVDQSCTFFDPPTPTCKTSMNLHTTSSKTTIDVSTAPTKIFDTPTPTCKTSMNLYTTSSKTTMEVSTAPTKTATDKYTSFSTSTIENLSPECAHVTKHFVFFVVTLHILLSVVSYRFFPASQTIFSLSL